MMEIARTEATAEQQAIVAGRQSAFGAGSQFDGPNAAVQSVNVRQTKLSNVEMLGGLNVGGCWDERMRVTLAPCALPPCRKWARRAQV